MRLSSSSLRLVSSIAGTMVSYNMDAMKPKRTSVQSPIHAARVRRIIETIYCGGDVSSDCAINETYLCEDTITLMN